MFVCARLYFTAFATLYLSRRPFSFRIVSSHRKRVHFSYDLEITKALLFYPDANETPKIVGKTTYLHTKGVASFLLFDLSGTVYSRNLSSSNYIILYACFSGWLAGLVLCQM